MGVIYENLPELRQQAVDKYFALSLQNVNKFWGNEILPVTSKNEDDVKYRVYDAPTGIMAPVHPDAPAVIITPTGAKDILFKGISYKEKKIFTAKELSFLMQSSDDIRDAYLNNAFNQLAVRAYTRIEQLRWACFTGSVAVNGSGYSETISYGVQTATTTASWKTAGTNILADMVINAKKISDYGGYCKYIVMNSTTYANTIGVNTYFQDKLKYGGFINEAEIVNKIINERPELKGTKLVIYDEGYIPDGGSKTLFVPNDVVFYLGGNDENTLGEFILVNDPNTIAIFGEPKSGFWNRIIEHDKDDPYFMEFVYGFTGLPAIVFPKWVVYDSNIAS